jgi:glycine/D-amino acid oxidase-like deaminating enzyme
LVIEYIGCKDPRADGAHSVGEQIYIIPRPDSGGLVTLGGCFRPGDWRAHPDPQRAERILKEAYGLCPLLAGHQEWREGGWEEIQVVSHNAGLRPCRKGGARIEMERMKGGHVLHAYGLASSGYQWSKGVAEYAAGLVLEHLGRAKL